jgi:uncharacterized protein
MVSSPRTGEPAREWHLYVAPMALFLVLTALEGVLPKRAPASFSHWYPAAYAAKIVLVTVAAWFCRPAWRDLRPRPRIPHLALAVILGLAVAAVWIGLDGHYPALPLSGKRSAFDPMALAQPRRALFLAVRLFGLVILVPLVEELFWRSFVIRWIQHPDFRRVPVGQVTWLAALVTSALFALAHPEWLPALLTGLAWAWLLRATRSVSACVISHAVANLALGIYVLLFGAWKFW